MISLGCSGSSKKWRMEDRNVGNYQDHGEQPDTLPKYTDYAEYAK
jgi:hypothetical protein